MEASLGHVFVRARQHAARLARFRSGLYSGLFSSGSGLFSSGPLGSEHGPPGAGSGLAGSGARAKAAVSEAFNRGSLALAGHFWTLHPHLEHELSRWMLFQKQTSRAMARLDRWALQEWFRSAEALVRLVEAAEVLEVRTQDPITGEVILTGHLTPANESSTLLVVVHGLGGAASSRYALRAALQAEARDVATLRVNLRGAEPHGVDFYHAGLVSDLDAMLSHPRLDGFRDIFLLGFSLGGHLVLRAAVRGRGAGWSRRLRGVAAVCAPLDLARAADAFDEPRRWLYRSHILSELKRMLARTDRALAATLTAKGRPLPTSAEVQRIRTIRGWDDRVVAPRHGYESADHYYRSVSVAPHLRALSTPTLMVYAEHDPMVAAAAVRPALDALPSCVTLRWHAQGGHVGFPSGNDATDEVLAWMRLHGDER